MAEKEFYTVKEYAAEACITQQAVYKKMSTSLKDFVEEIDGQKFIKKEAVEKLKEAKAKKGNSGSDAEEPVKQSADFSLLVESLNKTVELLQSQLEVKDQQIKDLNDRLEQALNNTSQSHYIAVQAQHKPLEATEPAEGSEHKETVVEATEAHQTVKKGLFSWLFGNK